MNISALGGTYGVKERGLETSSLFEIYPGARRDSHTAVVRPVADNGLSRCDSLCHNHKNQTTNRRSTKSIIPSTPHNT